MHVYWCDEFHIGRILLGGVHVSGRSTCIWEAKSRSNYNIRGPTSCVCFLIMRQGMWISCPIASILHISGQFNSTAVTTFKIKPMQARKYIIFH